METDLIISKQRNGPVGSVQERRLSTIAAAVAGLPRYGGRGSGLDASPQATITALSGLRGIPPSFVHRAVSDPLHEIGEGTALLWSVPDRLGEKRWITRPLPRALAGAELQQFCRFTQRVCARLREGQTFPRLSRLAGLRDWNAGGPPRCGPLQLVDRESPRTEDRQLVGTAHRLFEARAGAALDAAFALGPGGVAHGSAVDNAQVGIRRLALAG